MKRMGLLLLILWPALSAHAAPCDEAVAVLRVPAGWTRTVSGTIVTWRSPASTEALTIATYAVSPELTARERDALALKAVELERATERRWGSARLTLGNVARIRNGTALQLCHAGEDADQRRRFVSVTRLAGNELQHAYYESSGLPTGAFARTADAIFAAEAPRLPAASLLPLDIRALPLLLPGQLAGR